MEQLGRSGRDAPESFTLAALPRGASDVGRPRDGRWRAGQRLLPRTPGSSSTSRARARRRRPTASRTRSRCRSSSGMTADGAAARLAEQPLGAASSTSPRSRASLPGSSSTSIPRRGGLSAHRRRDARRSRSRSTASFPNFVGSSLADARRELKRLGLRATVERARPGRARSSRQMPRPGVAAAPGSRSRSWSGTAHERRAAERVAPRCSLARVIPTRGPRTTSRDAAAVASSNGGCVERQPVVRAREAERLREAARAGAQERASSTPRRSRIRSSPASARARAGAPPSRLPPRRRRCSRTSGSRTSDRRTAWPGGPNIDALRDVGPR